MADTDLDRKLRRSANSALTAMRYRRMYHRYKITYQWRNPEGCVGDPRDFRSWRCFASIPILFHTYDEAKLYMKSVDIFKNLRHLRKVSASIDFVILRRPPTV
jgi:hypothetical protein